MEKTSPVKFERRHLQAIADVFKANSNEYSRGRNQVLEALIDMFKADNPRFDESKFRAASRAHKVS